MPSSMANETFIDTSGFYSLLVRRDRMHTRAAAFMANAARDQGRFITTDYVLDESVTLLKTRGLGALVRPLFESIDNSAALRIEWTTSKRFDEAKALCMHYADKAWSFTDCVSFVVMRSLGLIAALTTDGHFAQAGYRVLLKE